MTELQCRSFGNLLLLCQAHHAPVDDKTKEKQYPAEELTRWKHEREGDSYSKLAGLDILGQADLQRMMSSVVTEAKSKLTLEIDRIATANREVAEMLHILVRENFDRPYLDLDAVALLADAAQILRHLPDSATALYDAARVLEHLEDNAGLLLMASNKLSDLHDNAALLRDASDSLNSLTDQMYILREIASGLDASTERASNLSQSQSTYRIDPVLEEMVDRIEGAAQQFVAARDVTSYQMAQVYNWRYFFWGFGMGAILIVIAVVWLHNRGTV